jgi:hypothetical protein
MNPLAEFVPASDQAEHADVGPNVQEDKRLTARVDRISDEGPITLRAELERLVTPVRAQFRAIDGRGKVATAGNHPRKDARSQLREAGEAA